MKNIGKSALAGMIGGVAVTAATVTVTGLACAGVAVADPEPGPYPDISRYAKLDFEEFRLGAPAPEGTGDLWFSTPQGLNCAILDGGSSFGCNGPIPGAPAGTNQIGSFPGDQQSHYDNTERPRFTNPGGLPQRLLPPQRYIQSGVVTCAVTDTKSVYCRGLSYSVDDTNQFLVGAGSSRLGSAEGG